MRRSLIIDGSPVIRKVARAILSNLGFEVVEAASGHAGIIEFNRHIPRLVMVDASLADMSALDVLRHVRKRAGRSVQSIYCTTQFDVIEVQQACAAGATDLLVKPFDRQSLAAKLQSWQHGDTAGAAQEGFYDRLSKSEIVRIG